MRIRVHNRRVHRSFVHATGPIEFGRAPATGANPRFVVYDESVSRSHLRVKETDPHRILLENLSRTLPVQIMGSEPVEIGGHRELELPVRLTIGTTIIEIEPTQESASEVSEPDLGYATIALPAKPVANVPQRTLLSIRDDLSPERLIEWFETLVTVLRAAGGSQEFYQQTAKALVELVGMDSALVLLAQGDDWRVVAEHRTRPASEYDTGPGSYSHTLVASVVKDRRTLYRNAAVDSMAKSLFHLDCAVASPIIDGDQKVVGVLYASRDLVSGSTMRELGPLEAQIVQLLAVSVATGLARVRQEAEAVRSRVQFEQFFSRELADELQRDPTILEGREQEVTVLFADIRGFSRFAQKLGARDYYRMAEDVLSRLTERVNERRGIVVDYTGDGLLAMWNAPISLADHAQEACRAALAMTSDLPALSATWSAALGVGIEVGIGINTGVALVGNTGTPQKMKYGPRGHQVNVGARIEGVTKHLGVRIILSGSVPHQGLLVRRLGRVQLQGLADPVEIAELIGEEGQAPVHPRYRRYEEALACFEAERFDEAQVLLQENLADEGEMDLPTFQLLARTLQYQKNPPAVFDPTWTFDSK